MIVRYDGAGPQSPPMLDLEQRIIAKEHYRVTLGEAAWLPDDYLHHNEVGEDVFKQYGIRIIEQPIPLRPKAFSHAKDGESLLVVRQYGGFGDILMQTMIWPNLRRQFPSSRLTFAVPVRFHTLLEGNPYLDEIANLHLSSRKQYDHTSDISTVCGLVENLTRPCTTHRADIWADHLGVVMDTHEGFYRVTNHERLWAEQYVKGLRPRAIAAVVPYSADKRKDLPDDTTQALIDLLTLEMGVEVCVLHSSPTTFRRAHSLHELNYRWLGAFLTQADVVISVDTGTLHLAAILKRPTVAIYGSEDGRVFTKYYPTVTLIQEFRRACQPCWYMVPCLNGDSKKRPGDCLHDLKAEDIASAAETMLKDSLHG
jgi:ADP-heptose:LPS heptosyltransferase